MNLHQVIEMVIYSGPDVLLLGIAAYVFKAVSKVSGILMALSALCALLMELSFYNVLGLGFVAKFFLSEMNESGELIISASTLVTTAGITKIFLVVGVILLTRNAVAAKKGTGNAS